MDSDFTEEQIDDAVCMVVGRYGRIVRGGRLEFYSSTERMIQVAAGDHVAEHCPRARVGRDCCAKGKPFRRARRDAVKLRASG
jgi:hypothetical protein